MEEYLCPEIQKRFRHEEQSGKRSRLPHPNLPIFGILWYPAIQTGKYTFRIDPDYFGTDPERLWSGITICVEADGNAFFKPAVQELNLQVRK